MGRADGVRRMQNETGYPVGEEIFDAGTVSGGVYPCLFSGDGGTGLLADREPDKSSGRHRMSLRFELQTLSIRQADSSLLQQGTVA